jgi:benzoyl-CoA reductase/2-hydroxyglutaryl-CoA dehydratase subunit BcrC/BadD/HgdB
MLDKISQKTKESIIASATATINNLNAIPNRPRGMAYFEKAIQKLYQPESTANKKTVGSFCMMIPEELVYAAGASSVRLCAGSREAASHGEKILSSGACPMVKSVVGFASGRLSPVYESCDTVIIPTTCGWKKKLGEILQDYSLVWWLEVPHIKDTEASRRHWYEEVAGLKRKLEELTGHKITRKKLLAAIKSFQKVQREFRRFYQLRKNNVISGRDALLVMQSYFYDEHVGWGENLRWLNDELEERAAQNIFIFPPSAPRILLTGSPILFPNWKIPDLLESLGGVIVMDEFCTSSRYIYDLVAVDELSMPELLKAVADRYLLPCTCPCFTPNADRMEKVLQMIEDFQVDGVLYHVLTGCHPYDIEMHRFEKVFRQMGIPCLRIETDYGPEDVGQIRTRTEAFLETIIAKRQSN